MIKLLIAISAIAAVAAWLTRPDEAAAEAEMKTQLLAALERLDLEPGAGAAAVLLCKTNVEECYEFTRASITTEFEDRTFYTLFRAKGFGEGYSCIGAFTRFICSGHLNQG